MSSASYEHPTVTAEPSPLHVLLDERAAIRPTELAYRFLSDGEQSEELLHYGELAFEARALASELIRHGAGGQPVLLTYPPGSGFITGLFACWYAEAIAVPCYPPRGSRHVARLNAIAQDSGARFVIAPGEQAAIAGLTKVFGNAAANDMIPQKSSPGPCLIQYTSGSTATPKGVKISHANLRAHFKSLQPFSELDLKSAVSWLPPYHDMGLVLKILYAFEAGIPLTFFSPEHFIQRPARWLQAISRYRGELSGAPNFAFEMCIRSIRDEDLEGLDLSCWKVAPCGAERIRPETLERFAKRFAPYGFRAEAVLPGYGLAETTLIATASPTNLPPRFSKHPKAGRLVSCGVPLPGVSLRIVDPIDGRVCGEREAGEIRIKGPSVASGYWNSPEATLETFGPETDGELRTGDLGYLEDGHLYVSGRIKDLIIIDGVNHAPEDIESVVFSKLPEVTAVAVFATDSGIGESVVIAIEVEGISSDQRASTCARIRFAVADAMELPVHRVIIVRRGLLSRTTSGKIRRSACREAFESGTMRFDFSDEQSCAGPTEGDALALVLNTVTEVAGRPGAGAEDDCVGFGMSSIEVTRLSALIEARSHVALSIGELFAAGSFREIADSLGHRTIRKPALHEIIPDCGLGASILTHSQERMWFLHQLDPESAAYHVFGALEMTGALDATALNQAIAAVVTRHDILRSRHATENGKPRVTVERCGIPTLEIRKLEDESALENFLKEFARKPFDLAHESPIRIALTECGEYRHVLAVCAHHIVADGWSLRILAREISACYKAIRERKPPPIFPEKPSYLDYAACHRRWVDSGAVDSQIDWWKNKLAGHSGVLQIVTDFPRPTRPSADGGAIELTLSKNICCRVATLAKAHRGTPFMVHLAAFLLLLRKHGAGDDPVVAIPIANRNHAVAGDLIGTLVNTLPFRLSLDPAESFATLLDRVREATFEMQANQDAPFERIIEAVKPDRSRDHAPLAQVMFDHQELPILENWSGGLHCKPYFAHRGAAQFDLSMLLTVLHDRQQLTIEYRTDLFLRETASSLLNRYLAILESVCDHAEQELTAITGLTHSDIELIDRVSQGPLRPAFLEKTTPALISRRVALHPQRIAFEASGGTLDYGVLDAKSSHLAANMRDLGVKPGDRVAILAERDLTLPVVLLAIWKSGAAYVPLDQANPPERLRLILEDQAPLHVLVSPQLVDWLPAETRTILLEERLMENSSSPVAHRISPIDPAYVIYTSGSTGWPKGVVVSHGALANFLLSMAEAPGFTEGDKLLAVTTISFDISALEIFLPLVTGGTCDIVGAEIARDGRSLLGKLKSSRATVMQATPATWRLLIDAGWEGSPDLKILCGGEALDLPLATQLAKMGCQLWNLYGPTETTVWSTLWRVPDEPKFIRIGEPIANTGIHILSADGTPAAPGVTGSLWISGAGLADGYWKRPDLTEMSFVSSRYNTGDLAKWHPDGTLECLGRSDGQVKIRGFRVELGEIEAALADHPQVAQAKVALRGADRGKLVAWVTPRGNIILDLSDLRVFLTSRLPAYMLPADIGVVDSFPLNSNGKVEVARLANPESPPQSELATTATERKLAEIWSELLERTPVHRDDDWFHSGGHSLLALRLFARIYKDFHVSLPLSAILDHPTLRLLASMIDETEARISVDEP
ncbi:MAG: amino acid adenylation domain-containing protein [Luteolibacter sp.]